MTQTPRLIVTISAPTATYHERVLGKPVPNGAGIRDYRQSKVGILVSTDHLAADVLEEP